MSKKGFFFWIIMIVILSTIHPMAGVAIFWCGILPWIEDVKEAAKKHNEEYEYSQKINKSMGKA